MDIQDLGQDRFLRKDPDQSDQTKDAVYTAANPAPKRGDNSLRKIGRPKGSEEDGGAPNILTGTVITSCFIQTTALPSRIEMQGNDISFYDDTTSSGGKVIGDTSRLIFTHGSGKTGDIVNEGFIWEKRASTHDSYDNVLSLYSVTPKPGRMNYMFFGQQGSLGDAEYHTNVTQFVVAHDSTATTAPSQNGLFNVAGSTDGHEPVGVNISVLHNSLVGVPGEGWSVLIAGTGTGVVGIVSEQIVFGSVYILQGSGSPEGVQVAAPGSLYLNTAGGAGTTVWAKESGVGDTGWAAVGGGGGAVNPNLTTTPGIGATSATLAVAWTGTTTSRVMGFSSGQICLGNFTNGSTSISWAPALTASAGSNQIATYL